MIKLLHNIVNWCLHNPKKIIAIYILITIGFLTQFPSVKIDTDPENMLRADEPVRVAHHNFKEEFALHDTIVVGVVNDTDIAGETARGVFTPKILTNIANITADIEEIDGVIAYDMVSLTGTDDIQGRDDTLFIEPLMKSVVTTQIEADKVKQNALNNDILKGMLVSEDGMAVAIAVPIKVKSESYRIAKEIEAITSKHKLKSGTNETYHITGLPVAEDTFGVEMFKQMAVSAPLAGLVIFLLMFFFFRKFSLITSPMIVAVMSVTWTMGLLIGTGHTVHILSSMIPIFLMPIAVVDSIHILSEFFDNFDSEKSREAIFGEVMDKLMTPMFYTSITSSVGFASLALTPIPPVQVFGLFVAFGIMSAWFLTITFIPAFTVLIPDKFITSIQNNKKTSSSMLAIQTTLSGITRRHAKLVIVITIAISIVAVWGVSKIIVNDNPVYWFEKDHRIRVADEILNDHFAGTYMSYLVLETPSSNAGDETFKQPKNLRYLETLSAYINDIEVVGKTTDITDIIKKISYELEDGDSSALKIPDNKMAVSQYLFLYELGGNPDDLYHLVTPDYDKATVWVHLKRGDNRDMAHVTSVVEKYISNNPPPWLAGLKNNSHSWAGLTYINVVWQNKMVSGMMEALIGSFVIVFLIMVILFRSFTWAVISMIPLTVTITVIYGIVGLTGKHYDMPIAVLSSLTLGLSIDFAIHLVQRARDIYKRTEDWDKTIGELFEEPVRAITRNAVVVAFGFTPLLFAPLMPYQTVGYFMAGIMALSGLASLIILPSLIELLRTKLKS